MDDAEAVRGLVARMTSDSAKASAEAAVVECTNLADELIARLTVQQEQEDTGDYKRIKFGDEFVHQGGGRAFMELGVLWGLKDEQVAVAWIRALAALQDMAACWGDIIDSGPGTVSLCLELLKKHKNHVELARRGLAVLVKFGAGFDFTLTRMGSVGACQVTVELLELHLADPEVALSACEYIWSLSCKRQDNNRRQCAAFGAVALAVKTLERYKLTAPKTANMAVAAIVSLVATYGWSKVAVAKAGGLELLLEYLRLEDDEHDSENVYFALQNLASVHAERLKELGVMELLISKEDSEEADETIKRLETWLEFWATVRLPLSRPWLQRQHKSGYPIWVNGETGEISEQHPALLQQPVPPLRTAHASLQANATEQDALRSAYSKERFALEKTFAESRRLLGEERRPALARGFWLGVLENHAFTARLIMGWDREALMDLQDITCQFVVDEATQHDSSLYEYELGFEFGPNPYFSNTLLKIRITAPNLFCQSGFFQNFARDGTWVGTEITWKSDITVNEDVDHGWNGQRYKRAQHRESFFDLFAAPTERESMDFIFEVAEALRCILIPEALAWHVGETKTELMTPEKVTLRPRRDVKVQLLENETKQQKLCAEYEAARLALEIKYQELLTGLFQDRASRILQGEAAIPGFWGAVIEASSLSMRPSDLPALAFLKDISLKWLPAEPAKPSVTSYEIGFHFAPNEYFSDEVLTMCVTAKNLFTYVLDPPECSIRGCRIHYKRGKNLSWRPRNVLSRLFRRARPFGFFDLFSLFGNRFSPQMMFVFTESLRTNVIPGALGLYLGTRDDPDKAEVIHTGPDFFIGSTAVVTFYDQANELA